MLAIVNACVETISNGRLENAKLFIKDKKIANIGKDIDISLCSNIIDAFGRTITPGLIDAHTHAGLSEQGIGWEGDDTNESTHPANPYCSVLDGINMRDRSFEGFRRAGITSVGVLPGSSNIIGGSALALKCIGTIVDEAIIKTPVGIKAALGENPKKCYGSKKQAPSTRMSNAAILRESLLKAKKYSENSGLNIDLNSKALVPVINREVPLMVHCHRHDDIVTAVRICREFDIRFVLEHATDGHIVADLLKKHNVHCAVGPTMHYGSKLENKHRNFRTPIVFERLGVPFCFTTDHPVVDARNLVLTAGIAVQWGMKEENALRAITLGPAEHIGIDDRVGSIEIGKDADLVVWSNNPLEFTSFSDITIIDGKIVYKREVY